MATEVAIFFGEKGGWKMLKLVHLGGGNSNIFGIFTPKIWEMIQFDQYLSNGGETHQVDTHALNII